MRSWLRSKVMVPFVAFLLISTSALAQKYASPFPREGASKAGESDWFAIWDVSFDDGKPTGMHQNALDQVDVFLADGTVKFTHPDGTWTIELVTKTGPCDQSYLGDVQVIDGALHLASASSDTFSGRVTPNGAVTLTSTMGGGNGVGSGRVSGSSGSGSWHAEMQNGVCSGVWSARRN